MVLVLGNPGPGGWANVLIRGEFRIAFCGNERFTTCNRMELLGVISALEMLTKHDSPVSVYSDSQYVVKGINEWMSLWKGRSWKGVKNLDLWQRLESLVQKRKDISFHWVTRNSNPELEFVDRLAKSQTRC